MREPQHELQRSIRVVGVIQLQMTWILVGSTCAPCSSMIYPRNWILCMPNEHLLDECKLVLPQGVEDLLKMMMSSKQTTTKELVNGHRISSIILMKVVGALVNPKGMRNHLKRHSLHLKVVFHTSVFSICTYYRQPNFISILIKYLEPLSWSRDNQYKELDTSS